MARIALVVALVALLGIYSVHGLPQLNSRLFATMNEYKSWALAKDTSVSMRLGRQKREQDVSFVNEDGQVYFAYENGTSILVGEDGLETALSKNGSHLAYTVDKGNNETVIVLVTLPFQGMSASRIEFAGYDPVRKSGGHGKGKVQNFAYGGDKLIFRNYTIVARNISRVEEQERVQNVTYTAYHSHMGVRYCRNSTDLPEMNYTVTGVNSTNMFNCSCEPATVISCDFNNATGKQENCTYEEIWIYAAHGGTYPHGASYEVNWACQVPYLTWKNVTIVENITVWYDFLHQEHHIWTYTISTEEFECITCHVAEPEELRDVSISEDGSKIGFMSSNNLYRPLTTPEEIMGAGDDTRGPHRVWLWTDESDVLLPISDATVNNDRNHYAFSLSLDGRYAFYSLHDSEAPYNHQSGDAHLIRFEIGAQTIMDVNPLQLTKYEFGSQDLCSSLTGMVIGVQSNVDGFHLVYNTEINYGGEIGVLNVAWVLRMITNTTMECVQLSPDRRALQYGGANLNCNASALEIDYSGLRFLTPSTCDLAAQASSPATPILALEKPALWFQAYMGKSRKKREKKSTEPIAGLNIYSVTNTFRTNTPTSSFTAVLGAGDDASYEWYVENVFAGTGSVLPSREFAEPGDYAVKLVAINDVSTVQHTIYIQVEEIIQGLVVQFKGGDVAEWQDAADENKLVPKLKMFEPPGIQVQGSVINGSHVNWRWTFADQDYKTGITTTSKVYTKKGWKTIGCRASNTFGYIQIFFTAYVKDPICEKVSGCDLCSQVTDCGWCISEEKCMLGNAAQSDSVAEDISCDSGDWFYGICPVIEEERGSNQAAAIFAFVAVAALIMGGSGVAFFRKKSTKKSAEEILIAQGLAAMQAQQFGGRRDDGTVTVFDPATGSYIKVKKGNEKEKKKKGKGEKVPESNPVMSYDQEKKAWVNHTGDAVEGGTFNTGAGRFTTAQGLAALGGGAPRPDVGDQFYQDTGPMGGPTMIGLDGGWGGYLGESYAFGEEEEWGPENELQSI